MRHILPCPKGSRMIGGGAEKNIRRCFLMARGVQQCNRHLQDIMGFPSREAFKQRLDGNLSGVL